MMWDDNQQYDSGNPHRFQLLMAVGAIALCVVVTFKSWGREGPPIPFPWIYLCILGGFAFLAVYGPFARRKFFEGIAHPLYIVRFAACTIPVIPVIPLWIGIDHLLDAPSWESYVPSTSFLCLLLLGIAFIIAARRPFVGKNIECRKCKTINPAGDGKQFCSKCASDLTETGHYVNVDSKPMVLSTLVGVGLLIFAAVSSFPW